MKTKLRTLITVSIIEDDKNYREGLELLINSAEGFKFGHSYSSAEKAMEHIVTHPPHIAIVDIKLPGKSGIEFIERWY